MRIWQYASAHPNLETHLILHPTSPLPKPQPTHHLLQILAVGLNPVDYKPAEAPYLGSLAVRKPATPGFDIAGRIVTPAENSALEPGELVFGTASTNPFAGGGLAEYVCVPAERVVKLPAGSSPLVAAGVAVAGLTAYASLQPYIKSGSRVFINGGSGGVGTYAIRMSRWWTRSGRKSQPITDFVAVEIAKALGAHVTVSCSGRNAELCRSLGADEVLDYTTRPLVDQLRDAAAATRPFDHTVDNVFSDPALYWQAHTYSTPSAKFAEVASGPTLAFARLALGAMLLPTFLGGGQRKFVIVAADIKPDLLEKMAGWIVDGTVKPVTDGVYPMEEVVEAFKRQKSGRATGKIIINVAGGKY
ncbi:hypothetical protein LTR62_008330 [Meristemomyces frigidus]|uniref:Enoyl reductase (ER) domain-containing protein n=1 Tax=Meristemomyces frigidus TaxID=1508187 RepID=A0AAN7T9M4_9PEZI|nr:hypothetical protein LTR62_008330 [Meristemomyces frigidus]